MKIKSHSGTKKRLRVTSTGKVKVGKAAHRHLLGNKSKGQKSMSKKAIDASSTRIDSFKKLLPNAKIS